MSEAEKAADSAADVTSEERGTKRSAPEDAPDSTTKVHSANEWEKVDLGDTDRKQKFLRLMGASKKEHHGRFVIGEQVKHQHGDQDSKHKQEELETQFEHSMDYRLQGGQRVHMGLGFHKEEDADQNKEPDSSGDSKQPAEKSDEAKTGSEVEEGSADKEASKGSSEEGSEDKEASRGPSEEGSDDKEASRGPSEEGELADSSGDVSPSSGDADAKGDDKPDSSIPSKYQMAFVKSSS